MSNPLEWTLAVADSADRIRAALVGYIDGVDGALADSRAEPGEALAALVLADVAGELDRLADDPGGGGRFLAERLAVIADRRRRAAADAPGGPEVPDDPRSLTAS